MKKVLKIVKRLIMTVFLIYGYNLIVQPLNLMVPMNIITITTTTIFGIPGLLSFVIISLLIF